MIGVLFEDEYSSARFYPLSETRPLWDLRSGVFTHRERWEKRIIEAGILVTEWRYYLRDELERMYTAETGFCCNKTLPVGDDVLICNAAALVLGKGIIPEEQDCAVYYGQTLVCARISAETMRLICIEGICGCDSVFMSNEHLQRIDIEPESKSILVPEYIWNLVLHNSDIIRADFSLLVPPALMKDVTFIGDRNQIILEDEVEIDPFVVFDARKGPVVVRKGTVINSFTRIEGPCAVDRNCLILGAKIREGCSIGPNCRIGGEVEDSIFTANSNKYHDGFIGHACIGEWVNLGAMCTNSDLKNDYSTVKVQLPDGIHDSGETKVGCMIGDYCKLSIGTLMNTGTVLGVGAMCVHSGRMTPPLVPSMSWFIKNTLRELPLLEGFISMNETVMKRRGMQCSEERMEFLRRYHERTAEFRCSAMVEWNNRMK